VHWFYMTLVKIRMRRNELIGDPPPENPNFQWDSAWPKFLPYLAIVSSHLRRLVLNMIFLICLQLSVSIT
jgi:hypothetical protein